MRVFEFVVAACITLDELRRGKLLIAGRVGLVHKYLTSIAS